MARSPEKYGSDIAIIVGAARSGTKFLRDLLSAGNGVAIVPYDINYVWRIGNESLAHDEIAPGSTDEINIKKIRAAVQRLRAPRGARFQILIEKTVSNSLRVPFVNEVFPGAKFIHLVRDGRDVTASARWAWSQGSDYKYIVRKLRYFPPEAFGYGFWYIRNTAKGILSRNLQKKRIWGPRYKGIEEDLENCSLLEVCAKQWQRSVDLSVEALQTIPSDRVLRVRYEDLVSNSNTVVAVTEFLGIEDVQSVMKAYRQRVTTAAIGSYRSRLRAPEQRLVQEILQETLERHGYG